MATHCLRTQRCKCLAICRALTGTHTPLVESSSHRNLHQFPLSDPASLTQPATPYPQQFPHISNQTPPPRPAIAALCLQKEAILLLKNPLLDDARSEFQSTFYGHFLVKYSFIVSPPFFLLLSKLPSKLPLTVHTVSYNR